MTKTQHRRVLEAGHADPRWLWEECQLTVYIQQRTLRVECIPSIFEVNGFQTNLFSLVFSSPGKCNRIAKKKKLASLRFSCQNVSDSFRRDAISTVTSLLPHSMKESLKCEKRLVFFRKHVYQNKFFQLYTWCVQTIISVK